MQTQEEKNQAVLDEVINMIRKDYIIALVICLPVTIYLSQQESTVALVLVGAMAAGALFKLMWTQYRYSTGEYGSTEYEVREVIEYTNKIKTKRIKQAAKGAKQKS